jgi:hypothetical protein
MYPMREGSYFTFIVASESRTLYFGVTTALRALVCVGSAIVSLNPVWAVAQTPPPRDQDARTTTVYATVTAKRNAAISADSLAPTIDKQPAKIAAFRPAKGDSLVYAVLIDVSTSNTKSAYAIRSGAAQIFRSLSDRGQGYFGAFDATLRISQRPLSASEVDSTLAHIKFGGGTALFDAIGKTSSGVLGRQQNPGVSRRLMVVISDGDDNQSHMDLKEAIEAAEKEGISIFSLAPTSLPNWTWDLEKASLETGGKAVQSVPINEGISPLLDAIDGQWALSIEVAQPHDQKLHSLKVKSTPGISITAPAQIFLP